MGIQITYRGLLLLVGRHRCPPLHSGGIPQWSPPVFHSAGWAPVGLFPHHFFFFTSATLQSSEATSFTLSATLPLVIPTLCPPNNTSFLFSTSPTRTSTSHWVKLWLLAFLSAFSHESIVIWGISLNIHRQIWTWYDPHTGAPHLEWTVIYKGKLE